MKLVRACCSKISDKPKNSTMELKRYNRNRDRSFSTWTDDLQKVFDNRGSLYLTVDKKNCLMMMMIKKKSY